ncbi:hypothetical protein NDU88_003589 [Pleurodeles waltl]|uniref:Endonuclease/exonuclease/phosphatase domain-containing protein n=1 Tax=Pleurodeles waltl TaxID=8319 RepID=A0AAV7M985_PLEWA|nr:hypothetical protein NDU88_003589 [Pleurodeles waltl]
MPRRRPGHDRARLRPEEAERAKCDAPVLSMLDNLIRTCNQDAKVIVTGDFNTSFEPCTALKLVTEEEDEHW